MAARRCGDSRSSHSTPQLPSVNADTLGPRERGMMACSSGLAGLKTRWLAEDEGVVTPLHVDASVLAELAISLRNNRWLFDKSESVLAPGQSTCLQVVEGPIRRSSIPIRRIWCHTAYEHKGLAVSFFTADNGMVCLDHAVASDSLQPASGALPWLRLRVDSGRHSLYQVQLQASSLVCCAASAALDRLLPAPHGCLHAGPPQGPEASIVAVLIDLSTGSSKNRCSSDKPKPRYNQADLAVDA